MSIRPVAPVQLHDFTPITDTEKLLLQLSGPDSLFVVLPNLIRPDTEPDLFVDNGPTVDLLPVPTNKVNGSATSWTHGDAVLWATEYPLLAAFWATTGAHHSPLSIDTGVCVHSVRAPVGEHGAQMEVQAVTLMASWDHQLHFSGRIWRIDRSMYPKVFERDTDPGIWRSKRRVTVYSPQAINVTPHDLPFRPVEARPDEAMIEKGAQGTLPKGAPLRGPLECEAGMDPRYACGVTGGTFLTDGKTVWTVGDSWLPLNQRYANLDQEVPAPLHPEVPGPFSGLQSPTFGGYLKA